MRAPFPLLVATALLAGPSLASANPSGAIVTSGSAVFSWNGRVLTITNSPGAVINWQSFSIPHGETTRFIQPSASSAVLNRVVGADPSAILGSLTSNGHVFLSNPNGIVAGAGAQFNVGGLHLQTSTFSGDIPAAGTLHLTFTGSSSTMALPGTSGSASLVGGSGASNRITLTSPPVQYDMGTMSSGGVLDTGTTASLIVAAPTSGSATVKTPAINAAAAAPGAALYLQKREVAF